MRPSTKSASATRTLEKPAPTYAEADAMMMGFEFFDEKGKLNPRKIFFTKEKCPNETQRILSHLFGKIMKWSACRWAENLLKHVSNDQTTANKKIKEQFDSLLQDIRKDGFVPMTRLFSTLASASPEALQAAKEDNLNRRDQKTKGFTLFSKPFLINCDEVVKEFQPQKSLRNQEEIDSPQTNSKDESANNIHLLKACQIIEANWNSLSTIHNGEHAPNQYKLPVKSGFLDFCRGAWTKKKKIQVIEQITWNKLFIAMGEKEWSSYKKIMTEAQYAAWTKKRGEWIAIDSQSTQARSEDQTPKRDLRLELKTEKPIITSDTARTIAQEFSTYVADFIRTSHGRLPLPSSVRDILDSGFIDYCDRGMSALQDIDLDKLEEFLHKYKSQFQVFGRILSPDNFSRLKEHRDNVGQDIAEFRATHPRPSNASEDSSESDIHLSSIEVNRTHPHKNSPTGLFSSISVVTYSALTEIDWDAADLYLKISLADIEKIHAYFSTADISEEHLEISKKLNQLSKQMRQIYLSDPRAFDREKTSDETDPADLLGRIYSAYLLRHTRETRDKGKASIMETSTKKPRPDKKSKYKSKNKTVKNRKPKMRPETNKPLETKTLDESQTLVQEARVQLNDAIALISRMNEKLNKIQH